VHFEPAIRALLLLSKKSLNGYYDKTDNSELYRAAVGTFIHFVNYVICTKLSQLVFQPEYKLEYIRQAGWDDEWINTARNIVRAEYMRKYAPKPTTTSTAMPTTKSKSVFDALLGCHGRTTSVKTQNEFDTYINTDPEKTDDPIGWWIDNEARFPTLSHMALDYLAIPGKSYLFPWCSTY
jgi:hypothetical protein